MTAQTKFLGHVTSSHWNFLEVRDFFTDEQDSTSLGLIWDSNIAAISLFQDTNMAAYVTSDHEFVFLVSTGALW